MVFRESRQRQSLRSGETRVLPELKKSTSSMRREKRTFLGRVTREVEVSDDTTIEFLPSGRASLEKELELIEHPATDHVYVQSFSLDDDGVGQRFVQTFEKATQKHPHVSYGFLVDHIYAVRGGFANAKRIREMLTRLNSNERVHVAITNFFNFFGIHENPFHRNHQKLASDGKRAVLTTANIGDHHTRWVDAGLYFEGPVAKVIDEIVANTFGYARRWKRVYDTTDPVDYVRKYGLIPRYTDVMGAVVRNADDRGQKITVRSKSGQIVEVLTDSFYRPYQEATNAAFDMVEHAAAGSHIDILTPYPGLFTLTSKILAARKNNVTINLYIPSNNDYMLYNAELVPGIFKPIINKQLDIWKRRLKAAGVSVFTCSRDNESDGMAHVKAIRVRNQDGSGKLWFGSSNLNKGLLAGSNREIAVVLDDKRTLAAFDGFVHQYQMQATQLF